jgi:WD40 repeat protein
MSIAFSPDGESFVSGSFDNSIILWDIDHETILRKFLVHTAEVVSVAMSPDEQTLLSAQTDGTLRLWNLQNGAEYQRFSIQSPADDASSAAFSPDGTEVYAQQADGSIGVWDIQTGAQARTIQVSGEPALGFILNPADETAASVLDNGAVVVWEVATGDIIREMTLDENVAIVDPSALAFSPDEHHLLGGGDDFLLHLWNADTGEEELVFDGGHTNNILSVAFSPDGTKAASGAADRTVILWDVATGSILYTLEGHGDFVQSVTFSPDGKWLLSASWDNTLRLWAVDSGDEAQDFVGHSGAVINAQFNADGSKIVSGSTDGSLRVWDVERGLEIRRFDGWNQPVQSVDFSPDGHFAFSVSLDNALRIWHIDTPDELLEWIPEHRYVRDLTCDERATYDVQPLCNQAAASVVVDTANVWERADENSTILSEVYNDEDFPVIDQKTVGGQVWYQIEMPSGQRGWIRGEFVKVDQPVAEP